MMSRNFARKLTPYPYVVLKCMFYLHFRTYSHKIAYPPPPCLCDIIYRQSPIFVIAHLKESLGVSKLSYSPRYLSVLKQKPESLN